MSLKMPGRSNVEGAAKARGGATVVRLTLRQYGGPYWNIRSGVSVVEYIQEVDAVRVLKLE